VSNYAGENDDSHGPYTLNEARTNAATNTIAGMTMNTGNWYLSGNPSTAGKGLYHSTYYRQYGGEFSSTPIIVSLHNNVPAASGAATQTYSFIANRSASYAFPPTNDFTSYFTDDNSATLVH